MSGLRPQSYLALNRQHYTSPFPLNNILRIEQFYYLDPHMASLKPIVEVVRVSNPYIRNILPLPPLPIDMYISLQHYIPIEPFPLFPTSQTSSPFFHVLRYRLQHPQNICKALAVLRLDLSAARGQRLESLRRNGFHAPGGPGQPVDQICEEEAVRTDLVRLIRDRIFGVEKSSTWGCQTKRNGKGMDYERRPLL